MRKNLTFIQIKSHFFLVLLLFVISYAANAQHVLQGKISDISNKSSLPAAFVYIPALQRAAIADSNGLYEIKDLPAGNYLVAVSYVGYLSAYKQIVISGTTELNVGLQYSAAESPGVVVTGVLSPISERNNPVPVSFVTHSDLQKRSSTNIIDALSYAPGVSQITMGPAISKPVIRGLGYNRVVVVDDGIRQEGQQFGDEFGIEVDPYLVDHVEILRGPASLSYGSDAMAGVINMLDAPALPEGQVRGNIMLGYETNTGMYGGSANIAGNNKGLTWSARYSYSNAHAYKNKYDGYVFNSGFAQSNFKGSIGLNKSWGYSKLTVSSFDLKPGIVEGGRDPETGEFNRHIATDDGEDTTIIVSADELKSYDHNLIIHQHVRHYKAVLDNNFVLGKGDLNLRFGFQQNHRQEANDATLGNVYNIYFHLNTFTYDIKYVTGDKKNFEFSVGSNGMQQSSKNLGTIFLVPEYNLFDVGVFAIGTKSIDKLTFSAGLRFDNRALKGDDLYIDEEGNKLEGSEPDAIHRFTAYSSNFSGVSGSIGAAYNFSDAFYAKLNIARGFRAPNIAESGSNGIHDGTPFYEIGDPTLKPETSIQLDATLGVNVKDVSAELTFFNNNISNYIFPVKLQSVFGGDSLRADPTAEEGSDEATTFKFISGDAVLTGAELTFNVHPQNARWFHFNNTFSMVNAIQKNQGDSTKYLPYTPPAKLISGITFTAHKAGKIFSDMYFSADLVNCFEQSKVFFKFGNETVTPGYTLLNIGAGANILSRKKLICSLYLYANNITNTAYQSNMSRLKYTDENVVTGRTGIYEMGRNFSIKLSVPLDFKK